jgi:hypothetical protein
MNSGLSLVPQYHRRPSEIEPDDPVYFETLPPLHACQPGKLEGNDEKSNTQRWSFLPCRAVKSHRLKPLDGC